MGGGEGDGKGERGKKDAGEGLVGSWEDVQDETGARKREMCSRVWALRG